MPCPNNALGRAFLLGFIIHSINHKVFITKIVSSTKAIMLILKYLIIFINQTSIKSIRAIVGNCRKKLY